MANKKLIRQEFRNSVFKRDKMSCLLCHKKHTNEETLDAHHITDRSLMPNGGYVKENGISVCKENCHMMVEAYHISGGITWISGLHPDDLYKMIGSSKELAIEKSNELEV
jgi:hypothetical protein